MDMKLKMETRLGVGVATEIGGGLGRLKMGRSKRNGVSGTRIGW